MRTLLLRVLLILVVVGNQSAIADDSVARMQRYSKINQLFDSPFYSIGIRDISSMMAVDLWDFNWFSDCIIQDLKDSLNISENKIFLNNMTKTLTIRNVDWIKDICPFPVKELVINFNGEKEDAERSLSLSYKIATTSDTFDDTYKICQDMLDDMCPLDSSGIFAAEGPYSHVYTIDGSRENESISFTCKIKVPADVWYTVPAGYTPDIGYKELPKNAPCNSGKEPFVKFLKKFNKDAVFRLDRRGFSDRADHADKINGYNLCIQFRFMEPVLSALDECGLIPLKGHYSRKEFVTDDGSEHEKESCGQWYYPTENSVIYSGWKTDWGSPEDDAGIVILFERIDEEWNAVAILPTGNRLNKTIIRIMKETFDEE